MAVIIRTNGKQSREASGGSKGRREQRAGKVRKRKKIYSSGSSRYTLYLGAIVRLYLQISPMLRELQGTCGPAIKRIEQRNSKPTQPARSPCPPPPPHPPQLSSSSSSPQLFPARLPRPAPPSPPPSPRASSPSSPSSSALFWARHPSSWAPRGKARARGGEVLERGEEALRRRARDPERQGCRRRARASQERVFRRLRRHAEGRTGGKSRLLAYSVRARRSSLQGRIYITISYA